jgi:hypothetical protein
MNMSIKTKMQKMTVAAALLSAFALNAPASAQFAGQYDSDWPRFFSEMIRPMAAKMSASDKKKAMEMELAIQRMESDHAMSMMKFEMSHRATIQKMRRELEDFYFQKGGAQ